MGFRKVAPSHMTQHLQSAHGHLPTLLSPPLRQSHEEGPRPSVPGWTLEVFMNFRLDGAGITELKMNLRTNCASRDRGQVFFLRKTHGRGSLGRVQTVQSMPSWG